MLKHVRKVEVEIHSKCNRKCDWCPNKTLLRDKYLEMDEDLYINILNDLKDNNFAKSPNVLGMISFARYCEPFYNVELLRKRLNQARKILGSDIILSVNSNGDYIKSLENLDINNLSIMDYDCIGIDKCIDKLKSLGVNIEYCEDNVLIGRYENIRVRYCVDWPRHAQLENRGGFFKKTDHIPNMIWRRGMERRNYSCKTANEFIAIDYNGLVFPCCHLRSDNPDHMKYCIGDTNRDSITDIYYSKKAAEHRKIMSSLLINKYPDVCRYCQKP